MSPRVKGSMRAPMASRPRLSTARRSHRESTQVNEDDLVRDGADGVPRDPAIASKSRASRPKNSAATRPGSLAVFVAVTQKWSRSLASDAVRRANKSTKTRAVSSVPSTVHQDASRPAHVC